MLGFPCNQFVAQEPGTDEEVLEFVQSKFDVDFPMFSKIEVNGDGTCALYQLLKTAQPGDGNGDIAWNFTKFLVDGAGAGLESFEPKTTPEEMEGRIQTLLLPS